MNRKILFSTLITLTLLTFAVFFLITSVQRQEHRCHEEKLPKVSVKPQSLFDDYSIFDFLEFCIPNDQKYLNEVMKIYPDASYQQGGGRVECDREKELLIFVEIGVPKETLCKLSNLEYVKKIGGSHFE